MLLTPTEQLTLFALYIESSSLWTNRAKPRGFVTFKAYFVLDPVRRACIIMISCRCRLGFTVYNCRHFRYSLESSGRTYEAIFLVGMNPVWVAGKDWHL